VREIAFELGYSPTKFNNILNREALQIDGHTLKNIQGHSRASQHEILTYPSAHQHPSAAYKLFNIHQSASNAEIKYIYRTLANLYHPDKLIGQKLSPYKINAGIEKFKHIQAAYEDIKKSRQ
jgi:DnaJ-domain-containing protein 1